MCCTHKQRCRIYPSAIPLHQTGDGEDQYWVNIKTYPLYHSILVPHHCSFITTHFKCFLPSELDRNLTNPNGKNHLLVFFTEVVKLPQWFQIALGTFRDWFLASLGYSWDLSCVQSHQVAGQPRKVQTFIFLNVILSDFHQVSHNLLAPSVCSWALRSVWMQFMFCSTRYSRFLVFKGDVLGFVWGFIHFSLHQLIHITHRELFTLSPGWKRYIKIRISVLWINLCLLFPLLSLK